MSLSVNSFDRVAILLQVDITAYLMLGKLGDEDKNMPENAWNTSLYESKHGFVWQYGESLLELLSPQLGERILDLGYGTGQLTEKIAIA